MILIVRLAASGCGKAELGDGEEELAAVAEFALFIGPGLGLLLVHPALLGHVLVWATAHARCWRGSLLYSAAVS